MAKYDLSTYFVTFSIPESIASLLGVNSITIGGEGSYTESISAEHNSDLYTLTTDATGSYVYNKSHDKSGRLVLNLNQMSDKVRRLRTLCNILRSSNNDEDGLTATISSLSGTVQCTCNDVRPQKIPALAFEREARTQTWTFLAGAIDFND